MTFSPNIRHNGHQSPRPYKDEGFWARVEDPESGWIWKRKGYEITTADLRKKGITNWLSLGEDMQWKIAEEIDFERVMKLQADTLKRIQESKEAKKKWQEEHGTN